MPDKQEDEGLFVAALYDYSSCLNLNNYIKEHNIPNPTHQDSFHTTIVHSVVNCGFEENHNVDIMIEPENISIDYIDNEYGRVLILKLDCPYLQTRYLQSIQAGASSNYYGFNPHITLSINIGSWDHTPLPAINFPLRIVGEYSKPLEMESLNYQT